MALNLENLKLSLELKRDDVQKEMDEFEAENDVECGYAESYFDCLADVRSYIKSAISEVNDAITAKEYFDKE